MLPICNTVNFKGMPVYQFGREKRFFPSKFRSMERNFVEKEAAAVCPKQNRKIKRWSFTLVEIIIVIIILGILAAIGLPHFRKTIEMAKSTGAYSVLNQIQKLEQMYFAENQRYWSANNTTAINTFDVIISEPVEKAWNFSVMYNPDEYKGFKAIATRREGLCMQEKYASNRNITLDENGTFESTWYGCIKDL